MDYFNILNLNKEPFSTSPDPDFFYGSRQHLECLQKLELALRLRRGLNVIIGDVGTGKTTLCRQLIRRFPDGEEFETHLILDPHFTNPTEFLNTVAKMFLGYKPEEDANDWQLKEMIKQYLFRRGVDDQKTVILIIDEGQKLPIFCLEFLREFLNYETNEYKLLQIVIFAQIEFESRINDYANFADRINLYHHLKPMNFRDSRAMIRFRLEKSSKNFKTYTFFSTPALLAIYWSTGGYPRKIINLCHRCVLNMIIQNRSVVNLFLARTCIRRVFPNRSKRGKKIAITAAMAAALTAVLLTVNIPQLKVPSAWIPAALRSQVEHTTSPRQPDSKEQTVAESLPEAAVIESSGLPPVVEHRPDTSRLTADAESTEELKVDAAPPGAHPADKKTIPLGKYIGGVTLAPKETISGLILNVYGDFNSNNFKSLILANPDIENPDLVQVGQKILMPTVPAVVWPLATEAWWISVDEPTSLEGAFQYLRKLPQNAPPIRLVSYWHPQQGITFSLLLSRYFTSKTKADQYLAQLSPEYAATGKIVSIWSEDAVYFTDPFFGRR